MDRKKVIGHLGILRTWCAVNPAYGLGLDVEDCGRAVGWLDDAIGMMKAEGERETTSSVSGEAAATEGLTGPASLETAHSAVSRALAVPKGEGSGEAQAAVVHGWWIIDTAFGNDVMSNGRMVLCSECGQGRLTGKTNYCPNCGAKMDGERRDGA